MTESEIAAMGTSLDKYIEGLRSADEALRAFIESCPEARDQYDRATDSVCILDAELRYLYISFLYALRLRLDPSSAVGKKPSQLGIIPEITCPLDEAAIKVYCSGSPYTIQLNAKAGSTADVSLGDRYYENTLLPFKENGQTVAVVCISKDVTERRRAEAEAEKILENSANGFVVLDSHFRYTHLNESAEKIINKPCAELLGRPAWESWPGINPAVLNLYTKTMQEKIPARLELYSCLAIKWYELHAYPWKDGLSVLFYDITERKRAGLRSSYQHQQELNSVVENFPDLIARYAQDLKHLYVNDAIIKLTGLSPRDIIGKTWSEAGMDANFYQPLQEKILEVFRTKREIACEMHYTRPDGRIKYIHARIIPETYLTSKLETVLLISRDITAEQHLEKEMSRLDRLNIIGQMAASLGHEVRNPLTTIRGFLQSFLKKKEFISFSGQFNLVIEELDRANSIITDYLTMAKNNPVELLHDNINRIIESLFPLIQADVSRHGHKVILQLDSVPPLLLDENELRQLIINFVLNGLEAMTESGTLTIATYLEDGQVVLAIKDTGKGIPQDIYEKLGTPFLTTKTNGNGLGLPVCYRVAEHHNAVINVETSPQGTTFLVRFAQIQQLPPNPSPARNTN